jgi:hypothetical protein
VAQAKAAAADRPNSSTEGTSTTSPTSKSEPVVLDQGGAPRGPRVRPSAPIPEWPQRARQAREALDTERRRRRLDATAAQPITTPARLGDAYRRRNLFLLPDDEDLGQQAPPTQASADGAAS